MSIARQAVRDVRHLLTGVPVALAAALLAVATLASAAVTVVGVGLPLLDRAVTRSRAVLDRQRRRVSGAPVAAPYRPAAGSLGARLRVLLTDPAAYRDLLFQLVALPFSLVAVLLPVAFWLGAAQGLALPVLYELRPGLIGAYLGVPIDSPGTAWLGALAGLLVAAVACQLPRGLIHLEARLTRALLGPTARTARPPVGLPWWTWTPASSTGCAARSAASRWPRRPPAAPPRCAARAGTASTWPARDT
ncbi:sensor domain-containing protein [Micromonospora costi]|uniref:sensor domain-containing protein n=1 Tax=Micromonospora costi TaxID=1530042 RepID=UPI001319C647|nr:sensor domain-containing protein [Micromonospora costi]